MRRRRAGFSICLSLSSLTLPACSNDGATLFAGFLRPGGAEVSLARDVQPIFNGACALSGCHAGSLPEAGMSLEASRIFDPVAGIVGVPSSQLPTRLRVAPGDADSSYLVDKLQGTQAAIGGSGAQMPFGGPPLNDAAILAIRKWIDQGAADN